VIRLLYLDEFPSFLWLLLLDEVVLLHVSQSEFETTTFQPLEENNF
jgi:hypothetical protein